MLQLSLKFRTGAFLAAFAALISAGCRGGDIDREYGVRTGGVASRGKQVITEKGCGSCHTIPGIQDARGLVGPPLFFFARRTYVAGHLPNNTENLVRWVRSPQSVDPLTAMPNLGLSYQQARDVAAYLYTIY